VTGSRERRIVPILSPPSPNCRARMRQMAVDENTPPEATDVAASDVPPSGQAAGPAANAPAADVGSLSNNGNSTGFAKDINDYLNHYITLADAKAGAVLAADLAICAALFDNAPAQFPPLLLVAAISLLGLSALACCVVVFPRLPSGRNGLIFWEDIRTRNAPEVYAAEVESAGAATVVREYARQNWYVSSVLHNKHWWVRVAIVLFIVGVAVSALWSLSARWYA